MWTRVQAVCVGGGPRELEGGHGTGRGFTLATPVDHGRSDWRGPLEGTAEKALWRAEGGRFSSVFHPLGVTVAFPLLHSSSSGRQAGLEVPAEWARAEPD